MLPICLYVLYFHSTPHWNTPLYYIKYIFAQIHKYWVGVDQWICRYLKIFYCIISWCCNTNGSSGTTSSCKTSRFFQENCRLANMEEIMSLYNPRDCWIIIPFLPKRLLNRRNGMKFPKNLDGTTPVIIPETPIVMWRKSHL